MRSLRGLRLGSGFRRFFTNTVFDSTFVLLGVVIGSAFNENPSLRVILTTMLVSSLSLGISTGVSVYEAESLEQDKKIAELERAMFRNLEETAIARSARKTVAVVSLVNFFIPMASFSVTVFPFLLSALRIIEIRFAAWLSIALSLGILFVAGAYLGRLGKRNPWVKGLRMLALGIVAFVVGYWVERLI
jgi:predicted membrane protein (TIGR00267 family)